MLKRFKICHTRSQLSSCFSTIHKRSTEQPLSLSYEKFEGDTRPPLVILHGLLGNKNNWKSIAKALTKSTNRTIYTVDCRNHGLSPHTTTMSYPLMGADVVDFLQQHGIAEALMMGHSMGGRAVMAAALTRPEVVSHLLVLDISPYGVSESISTLPRFVEMMLRLQIPSDLSMQQARNLVDKTLQPVVPVLGVRQFLLTNLYKNDNGEFQWRANLEVISRTFNPHICNFPLDESGKPYHGPTTFIGGALSDYLRPSDHDAISQLFPEATFHYLEGAGHWLHADKPKLFIDLVSSVVS